MEQKQPETNEKGYKKFPLAVGKDEISSSNLDSSSKKLLKSPDFRSFCSVIRENNEGQKVGQAGRPTT